MTLQIFPTANSGLLRLGKLLLLLFLQGTRRSPKLTWRIAAASYTGNNNKTRVVLLSRGQVPLNGHLSKIVARTEECGVGLRLGSGVQGLELRT